MPSSLGISGGIGSGKSTVCGIFKLLGIPVFAADDVAKKLINEDNVIKTKLIILYGEDIYTSEGTVNRKKLGGIIFNDDFQREKVNRIVHPVVRNKYELWLQKQITPYIIHEAAILFESGFYKMMDFTVLITAPVKMRIERIIKRDGLTENEIKLRMNKQWTDEQKRTLATLEIKNDNTQLIIPQLLKIDKQIREYGKIW